MALCSLLGNLIWFILGGLIMAAVWAFVGILLCLTIIGIPFGLQCFKIALFALFPFGKKVEGNIGGGACGCRLIFNVIWIVTFGLFCCLLHLFFALIFAVTIIGIPFASQHVVLARLALAPFGAKIYSKHDTLL